MAQEKNDLLDEFHQLLNKLEISEQITILETSNEKIKTKIQQTVATVAAASSQQKLLKLKRTGSKRKLQIGLAPKIV